MKTILFVSPTGTFNNGAEISIFNLMKYLVKEGYKVLNIAPVAGNLKENEYSKICEKIGVECVLVPNQRWWWEDAPGNLFGTEAERSAGFRHTIALLCQEINEKKVDLVITNTVNMFQGAVAAALESIPHFWLIHEFPQDEFVYYREKIDFVDTYSTEIFAVRGNLYNTLASEFPVEKFKSFIPFTELKKALIKKGLKHRIVSVGRLTKGKNQLELIKAFQQLGDLDLELVFIGAWDEEYKKICDQYIKENKIKNIIFTGNIENPWSIVTDQDICVFPSSMETFGLVYVEAVLNGIPVILSDNPGHCSSYELFNAGTMYPQGDIDILVRLIRDKIKDFKNEKQTALDFVPVVSKKYQVSIAYQDLVTTIENENFNVSYPIRHLKNLLIQNEKKSKLATLEFRIRTKIQKVKYKLFRK